MGGVGPKCSAANELWEDNQCALGQWATCASLCMGVAVVHECLLLACWLCEVCVARARIGGGACVLDASANPTFAR
eukprot:858123-Alexandrium_andersonii.AAC.1